MTKICVVATAALMLASCTHSGRDYNAATGAVIGGGTGAVVGGIASNSASGALAGGLVGAVAGGIIGAATTPDPCYVRTRSGRLRRVRCY